MPLFLMFPVSADGEYGSYRNPNPLPQDICDAKDLIKLNSCSNEILGHLQQCKANDKACECCALQLLKPTCFELCPGSPASNLLSVIIEDCESLRDVNACDLPQLKTELSYLSYDFDDSDFNGLKSKHDAIGSESKAQIVGQEVTPEFNFTEGTFQVVFTNILHLTIANSSHVIGEYILQVYKILNFSNSSSNQWSTSSKMANVFDFLTYGHQLYITVLISVLCQFLPSSIQSKV